MDNGFLGSVLCDLASGPRKDSLIHHLNGQESEVISPYPFALRAFHTHATAPIKLTSEIAAPA